MIAIPCLLVGGTEVHTVTLADALGAAGYEVTVCCYHESEPVMVERVRAAGASVDLLGLPRGRGLDGALALARALAAAFERHRPDIVHVQYMTPAIVPVAVARAVGVPRVVATIHVSAAHYGARAWLPRWVASTLCDAFLCVSEAVERSFFGNSSPFDASAWHAGRRHFTIHNAVGVAAVDVGVSDADRYDLQRRLGIEGRPVVGVVGRLVHWKGHDVLLRAMREVCACDPKAVLLCVGDGDRREALRQEAEQLGLADRVIWAGAVPPADVVRYLAVTDVVAMPSRAYEGFGLAAAEAMAAGKPVVASDVDGLAEVIGAEGAGILVPPDDVPALAKAIVTLLADEPRRRQLGQAARCRVERAFSHDRFAERHLSLYRALHDAPAAGRGASRCGAANVPVGSPT